MNHRCEGINKKRERCLNDSKKGEKYCYRHLDQDNKPSKYVEVEGHRIENTSFENLTDDDIIVILLKSDRKATSALCSTNKRMARICREMDGQFWEKKVMIDYGEVTKRPHVSWKDLYLRSRIVTKIYRRNLFVEGRFESEDDIKVWDYNTIEDYIADASGGYNYDERVLDDIKDKYHEWWKFLSGKFLKMLLFEFDFEEFDLDGDLVKGINYVVEDDTIIIKIYHDRSDSTDLEEVLLQCIKDPIDCLFGDLFGFSLVQSIELYSNREILDSNVYFQVIEIQ
jgi:hypothetical protein